MTEVLAWKPSLEVTGNTLWGSNICGVWSATAHTSEIEILKPARVTLHGNSFLMPVMSLLRTLSIQTICPTVRVVMRAYDIQGANAFQKFYGAISHWLARLVLGSLQPVSISSPDHNLKPKPSQELPTFWMKHLEATVWSLGKFSLWLERLIRVECNHSYFPNRNS